MGPIVGKSARGGTFLERYSGAKKGTQMGPDYGTPPDPNHNLFLHKMPPSRDPEMDPKLLQNWSGTGRQNGPKMGHEARKLPSTKGLKFLPT